MYFRHLELNQAATIGRSDGLGPADDVQLAENASHVRFYGGFADEQLRANVFVASAPSKKPEDIDFTAC